MSWRAVSQHNVDLVNALIPQGDIAPLFRNEPAFEQVREALAPVLTDDFDLGERVLALTRHYGRRKDMEALTRLRRWRYYARACGRHARR